ncbi:MAG: hypothetical protein ACP5P3_04945 [Ignavibacteria bacterium]
MILKNYAKITIYTTAEVIDNLKANLMYYSPVHIMLEDIKKSMITGNTYQEFSKMIELILPEETLQSVFEYLHTYYFGKYPVIAYSSTIIMP